MLLLPNGCSISWWVLDQNHDVGARDSLHLWLNCSTLRAAMGARLESEGREPSAGKAQGRAAALGSSSLCLKCLFI